MKEMKRYILETFKYRELGDNFTKKMKAATKSLKSLPMGNNTIGFKYKGHDIYLKPYKSYLLFYVVDISTQTVTILRVLQDGMDWKFIIKRWLEDSNSTSKIKYKND